MFDAVSYTFFAFQLLVFFLVIVKRQTFIRFFASPHKKVVVFQTIGIASLLVWAISILVSIHYGLWWGLTHGDLCTMASFLIIIPAFRYSDEYLRMVTPWVLLGAVLTYSVGFNTLILPVAIMSMLSHTTLLVFGLSSVIFVGSYKRVDYLHSVYLIAAFLVYVFLTAGLLWAITGDERWGAFSTGLLEPSYREIILVGDFIVSTYKILGFLNLPYPVPTILFYSLALLTIGGMDIAFNKINGYFHVARSRVQKII